MHVRLGEFVQALVAGHDVEPNAAMNHTFNGLVRAGLIGALYGFGTREGLAVVGSSAASSPFPRLAFARITSLGIELYGWAQGEPDMDGHEFVRRAKSFAEGEIPRLHNVAMPMLSPAPGDAPPDDASS
jgi:hypothetical protein